MFAKGDIVRYTHEYSPLIQMILVTEHRTNVLAIFSGVVLYTDPNIQTQHPVGTFQHNWSSYYFEKTNTKLLFETKSDFLMTTRRFKVGQILRAKDNPYEYYLVVDDRGELKLLCLRSEFNSKDYMIRRFPNEGDFYLTSRSLSFYKQ